MGTGSSGNYRGVWRGHHRGMQSTAHQPMHGTHLRSMPRWLASASNASHKPLMKYFGASPVSSAAALGPLSSNRTTRIASRRAAAHGWRTTCALAVGLDIGLAVGLAVGCTVLGGEAAAQT